MPGGCRNGVGRTLITGDRLDLRHPPAEVQVDVELARHLLETERPDLLTGELVLVAEGWDNFTYRVGRHHALRLPRREVAAQLLLNELEWLPHVAPWLHLAVPEPVVAGAPSSRFPWPWSVVRWIPGRTVEGCALAPAEAESLAAALRSLHRPAPPDAPFNPFRGVPLAARREVVEERLGRLKLQGLAPLWRRAIQAAPADASVWLHGDLHPRNVLIHDGRLVGIIDWGDMTAGDASTDLACAWMLFGRAGRSAFRQAYRPTETEWTRAMGWAVNFGSAMLDSGEPAHASIGRAIIEQLLHDRQRPGAVW